MSIVPSVMQVLRFEAEESRHSLELALAPEALPLKGAEQFPGIDHEQTFGWDRLRQCGDEPVYRCLDIF